MLAPVSDFPISYLIFLPFHQNVHHYYNEFLWPAVFVLQSSQCGSGSKQSNIEFAAMSNRHYLKSAFNCRRPSLIILCFIRNEGKKNCLHIATFPHSILIMMFAFWIYSDLFSLPFQTNENYNVTLT